MGGAPKGPALTKAIGKDRDLMKRPVLTLLLVLGAAMAASCAHLTPEEREARRAEKERSKSEKAQHRQEEERRENEAKAAQAKADQDAAAQAAPVNMETACKGIAD